VRRNLANSILGICLHELAELLALRSKCWSNVAVELGVASDRFRADSVDGKFGEFQV
jgi:hypothetical protein